MNNDVKKINVNFSGIFLTLLAIVFITLKLLGKITWSWVWVLAPIWIQFLIGIVLIVFGVLLIKWGTK